MALARIGKKPNLTKLEGRLAGDAESSYVVAHHLPLSRAAIMSNLTIRFTVELPVEHAMAFAQFLKRAGHSDYLKFTVNSDSEEAHRMLDAAERVRKALREAGIDPR